MTSRAGRRAAREGAIRLFESREYSDLLLDCDGVEFPVHRFVVCSRSKVIKAQVDGPFLEGASRRISMWAPAASPRVVAQFVKYLYTHYYDDPYKYDSYSEFDQLLREVGYYDEDDESGGSSNGKCDDLKWDEIQNQWKHVSNNMRAKTPSTKAVIAACRLINHAHVYAVADFYDVPDLRDLAKDNFAVALTMDAVELCGKVVSEVYEHTGPDDDLRELVITFAVKHCVKLAKDAPFLVSVATNQDFMIEMFKRLASAQGEGTSSLAHV